MKKAEQFVRRLIVQLFSCVRIDMAHHQINVFLFQRIKGCSLWQDTPDHFMGNFTTSFLIRTLGIAIKNMSSSSILFIKFDCQWICKFTFRFSSSAETEIPYLLSERIASYSSCAFFAL